MSWRRVMDDVMRWTQDETTFVSFFSGTYVLFIYLPHIVIVIGHVPILVSFRMSCCLVFLSVMHITCIYFYMRESHLRPRSFQSLVLFHICAISNIINPCSLYPNFCEIYMKKKVIFFFLPPCLDHSIGYNSFLHILFHYLCISIHFFLRLTW